MLMTAVAPSSSLAAPFPTQGAYAYIRGPQHPWDTAVWAPTQVIGGRHLGFGASVHEAAPCLHPHLTPHFISWLIPCEWLGRLTHLHPHKARVTQVALVAGPKMMQIPGP